MTTLLPFFGRSLYVGTTPAVLTPTVWTNSILSLEFFDVWRNESERKNVEEKESEIQSIRAPEKGPLIFETLTVTPSRTVFSFLSFSLFFFNRRIDTCWVDFGRFCGLWNIEHFSTIELQNLLQLSYLFQVAESQAQLRQVEIYSTGISTCVISCVKNIFWNFCFNIYRANLPLTLKKAST